MPTYDIKQQRKDLYAPKPGDFTLVDVPPLGFLMIDGHGDPNTSPAYREAVEALFATSYAVRSAEGVVAARTKRRPALEHLRFEHVTEGRSVQILHVGPYDDEAPTIDRLHREFLPAQGLVPVGRHHEIHLCDPRKTEPARLKTILRQPVSTCPSPGR